mmetsp:Transcript_15321/g.33795  ORF Transcript_15321/g.33795 Transcript_15321/m.33795 type:complete len:220 (-) Transcript_15321:2886-3545(-)
MRPEIVRLTHPLYPSCFSPASSSSQPSSIDAAISALPSACTRSNVACGTNGIVADSFPDITQAFLLHVLEPSSSKRSSYPDRHSQVYSDGPLPRSLQAPPSPQLLPAQSSAPQVTRPSSKVSTSKPSKHLHWYPMGISFSSRTLEHSPLRPQGLRGWQKSTGAHRAAAAENSPVPVHRRLKAMFVGSATVAIHSPLLKSAWQVMAPPGRPFKEKPLSQW